MAFQPKPPIPRQRKSPRNSNTGKRQIERLQRIAEAMELRRIGCADANQDLHLDAADRDALERCMLIAKRHPEPGEGSWLSCAQSACWGLQATALHLQPWETPPCTACEDDPNPRDKAATLLRKMLRAGLSRYEPDPLAALAKVKAKSKP